MYNSLLEAYDKARRNAAQNGMPVSKEEVLRALYPVYAQYAKDAITAKTLDQNKELFNRRQEFEQRQINRARPIQYANVGVSAANAIGTGLYANQQDDLYRQKLNLLMQMYGGNR